jgi:hypothetical protein
MTLGELPNSIQRFTVIHYQEMRHVCVYKIMYLVNEKVYISQQICKFGRTKFMGTYSAEAINLILYIINVQCADGERSSGYKHVNPPRVCHMKAHTDHYIFDD